MSVRFIFISLFITSSLFSQFKYRASGGYYDRAGNTDYKYYNLGFSVTSYGDISIGGITLKDSEFLLALDKNSSTYQQDPYEDDQSILLKFDLNANSTFSPFLIAETAFDKYRGIEDRSNYGIGAKYRIFGDILSISAAYLLESETVMGKGKVYEYAEYGDSLIVTKYSDHPSIKPFNYSRISIRPKVKLPLGENFYYQSEYYYKPAGDDVLTDWRNKFVIKTAEEWLNIEFSYNYKNDTQPAPKYFMKYDDRYAHEKFSFDNPGNYLNEANRPVYDMSPEDAKNADLGEYYIRNYKKNDTTLKVGISIKF